MVIVDVKVKAVAWQQPLRGAVFSGWVVQDDIVSQRIEWVVAPYGINGSTRICPGQWWHIAGEERVYQGTKQVTARDACMIRPCGEHVVDLFAGDPARFSGIGRAYGGRLYRRLQQGLVLLLDKQDLVSLEQEMKSLGLPRANVLAMTMARGWQELGLGKTASWLASLFKMEKLGDFAQEICGCWGEQAQYKIEGDPFRLVAFPSKDNHGDWKTVDDIARRLFGIEIDDPRRFHGATMDSIFEAYDEKNTIVDQKTLLAKLNHRLGSHELAKKAIHQQHESPAFLNNGEYWQSRAAFFMEKEVAETLNALRGSDVCGEILVNDGQFRYFVAQLEQRKGFVLGEEQLKALRVALSNKVCVITGGTGVGKTELLGVLTGILAKQGGRIVLMAPTTGTARRLAMVTDEPALTIAGFLSARHRDRLDEKTTVIIDGASTLSLPLMYQVLRTVPPTCRLVLVGDADQVAPVGPGLVLQVLAGDANSIFPVARLTRVYRRGSTSISSVAGAIREARWPELPLYDGRGEGVSVIPDSHDVSGVVRRVHNDFGGSDADADVQVLSLTTDASPYGVAGINSDLQTWYGTARKRLPSFKSEHGQWTRSGTFFEGDPVIYTASDPARNLCKGSLGRIIGAYDLPIESSEVTWLHPCARVMFDSGEVEMNVGEFENVELAYSMTVYKALGRQFRRIIIPIKNGRFLERNLLYTAVSMGVEQVVLVGDIEAAKASVKSGVAASDRQTGLSQLLHLVAEGAPDWKPNWKQ